MVHGIVHSHAYLFFGECYYVSCINLITSLIVHNTYQLIHTRVCGHFSCIQLSVILWTVTHQAPLSKGFSRQEYWNGLPCPPPGGSSQPKDWTHISYVSCICKQGFPCGSAGKESACNAGDLGSIPGLGRFPGEGKVYPLQYSGVENSIQSMGSQRVGHNWATFTSLHLSTTSTTWKAQLICIKLNLNFKLSRLIIPWNVYHCYHWNGPREDFSYIKEMHFIFTLNKLITLICVNLEQTQLLLQIQRDQVM